MDKAISAVQQKGVMRQSNIELLRIVTMVMIVAHHCSIYGGFEFPTDQITLNLLWIQLIQIGGKIGVDIFLLISGYFLVSSAKIKTQKVIKLWLQIFTYSVLIYVIFVGLGIVPFSLKELIERFLPIIFSQWWFASAYFVLYLISPYVNRLLVSLSKKEYQRMLLLLTVCWCLIPTVFNRNFESNSLIWFLYLYVLAGYIRLHFHQELLRGKTCIVCAAVFTGLTFLSALFFDLLGTRIPLFAGYATYFYEMQKLPILLISLFLFLGFLKMKIGQRKGINVISAAMFGVYLIHDNRLVRSVLWNSIFRCSSFCDSPFLVVYSVFVILTVFVVCTVIELLRIYVLEKHYMGLIGALSSFFDTKKKQFFSMKFWDKI